MVSSSVAFPPPYPRVRLGPKANVQAICQGFPWVYTNELVMDRRTSEMQPGTLAVLEAADRSEIAVVTINPASKIGARILDRDPAAIIDRDWLVARLSAALALRERLYDAPYYRLVHAESDGLPGIIVDRFGDVVVIQPNAAWSEALIGPIVDALVEVTGVATVIKNGSGRSRRLEGLVEETAVVHGDAPQAPLQVPMNGAIYMADVVGGQKTGLFYDQRPNHAFAASQARGGRVLDVFCHVGGFGLAAIAGGAVEALLVDGSANALALAQDGAKAMGAADRVSVRKGDAFAVLTTLGTEGATFDTVICDPPAFAPSRQAREAGLRAYERVAKLAAPLVVPGGTLVLCSCSHAADLNAFRSACLRGIGKAGRACTILYTGFAGSDHPVVPQLSDSGYLKAIAFRL